MVRDYLEIISDDNNNNNKINNNNNNNYNYNNKTSNQNSYSELTKKTIDEFNENDDEKIKIILPSELSKKKKKINKKLNKEFKKIKIISIIILLIIGYIFYQPFILYISSILKSNPTFYYYYLFIKNEISNHTILGLIFSSFFGSIFFLALPSEALFIYFLDSTNYHPILIILIMVFGNILGLIFNYLFGRLMGKKVLMLLFKEKKFFDYKEKIDEYGGIIALFGNIFPGPFEVLSVFYGGFKYKFSYYLFLSSIGRIIKYSLLFIAFYFYWPQIIYYWSLIKNII